MSERKQGMFSGGAANSAMSASQPPTALPLKKKEDGDEEEESSEIGEEEMMEWALRTLERTKYLSDSDTEEEEETKSSKSSNSSRNGAHEGQLPQAAMDRGKTETTERRQNSQGDVSAQTPLSSPSTAVSHISVNSEQAGARLCFTPALHVEPSEDPLALPVKTEQPTSHQSCMKQERVSDVPCQTPPQPQTFSTKAEVLPSQALPSCMLRQTLPSQPSEVSQPQTSSTKAETPSSEALPSCMLRQTPQPSTVTQPPDPSPSCNESDMSRQRQCEREGAALDSPLLPPAVKTEPSDGLPHTTAAFEGQSENQLTVTVKTENEVQSTESLMMEVDPSHHMEPCVPLVARPLAPMQYCAEGIPPGYWDSTPNGTPVEETIYQEPSGPVSDAPVMASCLSNGLPNTPSANHSDVTMITPTPDHSLMVVGLSVSVGERSEEETLQNCSKSICDPHAKDALSRGPVTALEDSTLESSAKVLTPVGTSVAVGASNDCSRNRKVASKERWRCDICDRKLKCKAALLSHRQTHFRENSRQIPNEEGASKELWECNICDKKLKSKSALVTHRRTHFRDNYSGSSSDEDSCGADSARESGGIQGEGIESAGRRYCLRQQPQRKSCAVTVDKDSDESLSNENSSSDHSNYSEDGENAYCDDNLVIHSNKSKEEESVEHKHRSVKNSRRVEVQVAANQSDRMDGRCNDIQEDVRGDPPHFQCYFCGLVLDSMAHLHSHLEGCCPSTAENGNASLDILDVAANEDTSCIMPVHKASTVSPIINTNTVLPFGPQIGYPAANSHPSMPVSFSATGSATVVQGSNVSATSSLYTPVSLLPKPQPVGRRSAVSTVSSVQTPIPVSLLSESSLPRLSKCVKCGEELKSTDDCFEHSKRHFSIRKVEDSASGEVTSDPRSEHVEESEGYLCPLCDKPMGSGGNLVDHVAFHRPIPCDRCHSRFKTKGGLERHQPHCEGRPSTLHCPLCRPKGWDYQNLPTHMLLHLKYICPVCCDFFQHKDRFMSHLGNHVEVEEVKCHKCGNAFRTANCLSNHMRRSHTSFLYARNRLHAHQGFNYLETLRTIHDPPQKFECDKCKRMFPKKRQLVYHFKGVCFKELFVGTGVKCEECGKEFRLPSLLRWHQKKKHHPKGPKKKVVCEICGKCVVLKNFKIHTQRHGERKLSCDICGFAFHARLNLQVHMRKHTGERPYKCEQCGDRFKTHGHLINHRETHKPRSERRRVVRRRPDDPPTRAPKIPN